MGDLLVQAYAFVKQEGGAPAVMRLAMMTTVPSSRAASTPDSAENLAKFRKAVKEITGKEMPNL